MDLNYNLPKYTTLIENLKKRFGNTLKPLGKISDVICGPFGSAIKSCDYIDEGLPLIRITNITKDGYMNYDDMIYISEELGDSLSRTQVKQGDIVISQRGSLGQCAVVDDKFSKLNISANIIAVKNIREVSAEFIRNYFLSFIGQKLLERNTSGQVQQKITTQDISGLLIPTRYDEESINASIKKAYSIYEAKLQEANELMDCFKTKIAKQCGINLIKHQTYYSAIKFSQLDGVIDAKRYLVRGNLKLSNQIGDVCEIVEGKVNVALYMNQLIDWIRIDDLPNQPIDIESVRTQPADEMEGSFFEVQVGDILVARLGPTILNQKIVLVRSVNRTTLASSEFLVLRCKKEYSPEAVMAILNTSYYRDLMYSKSRGSTPSRYRLNREDMLKLPFPDITDIQDDISIEANDMRESVKRLRFEAEREWQAAKKQFEKELLEE